MLLRTNASIVGPALAGALMVTTPVFSEGLVNLSFSTSEQSILIGDTVTIDLIAQSDGTAESPFVAMQAALAWDPDVFLLVGADDSASPYNWYVSGFLADLDGINDDLTDGDALYDAWASPGNEAMAPVAPDGLLITTLEFEAVGAGTDSAIVFLPENGFWGVTKVVIGGNVDVTGDISSVALITVTDPNAEPCPGDLDGNGSVGTSDLLALLGAWGSNPGGPPDFDGDGTVSTSDLLLLLGAWGRCP